MENKGTKAVPVQERTLRIYKPFIRCATCARNIDTEKIKHGFYSKTYCNYYKEARPDQYKADYDIEKDRKVAQHCKFYLPEVGTLTDLTYLKPFEVVDDLFELEAEHAKNLEDLFGNKLDN